jgi:protein phosphatase
MDTLQIAFKTHRGSREGKDYDSFLCRHNLFIVAEGVGGEHCGDSAKERAFQIIHESFFRHLSKVQSPGDALIYALEKANEDILSEREKLGENTAASVSVVYVKDRIMYFSHLGDSRIYSLHGGELNQLTRDHTLEEEGPFAEARFRNPRTIRALTEGLGIHERPTVNVKKYPLHKKDIIIMTTGGLTTRVSNREILRLSSNTKNPERLCNRLIDLARRKGGNGSMTVGTMRFGKLSKELHHLIILYTLFFLLILSAMGGYALKYREQGPLGDQPIDQPKDIQPVKESSRLRGDKDIIDEEREAFPYIQARENKPLQESPGQQARGERYDHIYSFISRWKAAWENTAGENSDIEHYISFYSENFLSRGLDKYGWGHDKAEKGRIRHWIRIDISDIKISQPTAENQVEVRFLQNYRVSNVSDTSHKVLTLIKEGKEWKITNEESY